MASTVHTSVPPPRWYLIPVRVLLMTFIGTLLSFAVSLLLGILGTSVTAKARGVHPDMTFAYRHVALPVAVVVAAVVLISACMVEVKYYLRAKALARIEHAA